MCRANVAKEEVLYTYLIYADVLFPIYNALVSTLLARNYQHEIILSIGKSRYSEFPLYDTNCLSHFFLSSSLYLPCPGCFLQLKSEKSEVGLNWVPTQRKWHSVFLCRLTGGIYQACCKESGVLVCLSSTSHIYRGQTINGSWSLGIICQGYHIC